MIFMIWDRLIWGMRIPKNDWAIKLWNVDMADTVFDPIMS
jgi:hypothetical protein